MKNALVAVVRSPIVPFGPAIHGAYLTNRSAMKSTRSASLRTLFVVAALAVAGGVPLLRAQGDLPYDKATSYLTIGPSFAGGASVSLEPPQGNKVAPSFGFRFGADMAYPLTSSIGGTFLLGYESRAVRLRSLEDPDVYSSSRVGYMAIMPGFQFGAFWIGMNFGLPLGGSVTRKAGQNADEISRDMTDTEYDKVDVTLEPRIGTVIRVHDDQNGWVGITLNGGLTLNEFFDMGDVPSAARDIVGNYQTASMHLGLTYQFAIPGTAR